MDTTAMYSMAEPARNHADVDDAARLRILHVLAPAPVGGLERVVRLLAAGQARAGHEVEVVAVVTPVEREHAFVEAARADGIRVRTLVLGARAYRAEIQRVRTLCAELHPDVVHTHGFRSDVVDGAAARSAGVPTVATVHGWVRGTWRGRVYEWLQRRALRRRDAVVAVSAPQVEELVTAGVPQERIHLVPNAWSDAAPLAREEARRRLGIPPDEFLVGWVGRLGAEKGPDVMVAAAARLAERGVRVSFIGDGQLGAGLRALAARLGAAHCIRWHGSRPDAGELFRAFDVFALTSRTEGTPMVLFEAMAAEVPIIAARVGGVPDVLPSEHALLVPPRDAAAVATAIDEVRAHPAAARERARLARARVEEVYAVGPWVARYDSVYLSARLACGTATGHPVPVRPPASTR